MTMMVDIGRSLLRSGLVDTHYHVGPELIVRRYDVRTLAERAGPVSATLVLKNHTYPTTPLAALARAHFGVRFFGGVVLNRFVGGINPAAVEGAVSGNRAKVDDPAPDRSPVVVWMPTVHAQAHIETLGHAFDPRWSGCCIGGHPAPAARAPRAAAEPDAPVIAFDGAGRPTEDLVATLEAVSRLGCILATGHLAAREIMKLVPLALEIGVPRIILTHPHYPCVNLGDDELARLARDPRVFIEHCFAIHTIEDVPLSRFVDAIRATGPDQVLLSTDFGQVSSAPFPEGTVRYAEVLGQLLRDFVSETQLVAMFCDNGRRALGLSAEMETETSESF